MTVRPILHHGNAADVLPLRVSARSVDMVYLDPPFLTQRAWSGPAGSFSDTWSWGEAAQQDLEAFDQSRRGSSDVLRSLFGSQPPALAFAAAMGRLIGACHRTLRPTGTLWLHCDDHAAHIFRLLCDIVFGPARFWGTAIWHRSAGANHTTRSFVRVHDTILVYLRTGAALHRLREKAGGTPMTCDGVDGRRLDVFFDDRLGRSSTERTGYPTQKPVALLSRMIAIASMPGDTVLDACCGSGTTLLAADNMGRKAIGVDRSADAIRVARSRFSTPSTFQPDLFGEVMA